MDPYFFYSGFSDRWYEKFLIAHGFEIKEITIFHYGKVININKKDFTANSRSAYIDNTGENLSFIIVKEGDEVVYIRFDKLFNSIEKIIIVTKFSKLDFVSNSLCLNN